MFERRRTGERYIDNRLFCYLYYLINIYAVGAYPQYHASYGLAIKNVAVKDFRADSVV